jgi:hypothetical protein
MRRGLGGLLLFCLVAGSMGCVAPHHVVPRYFDASNPVRHVALLPMKNDTSDVDGPNVMRKKMATMLEERAYLVKDTKETDQLLRDRMGINLGGQLDLTTAQKIGEVLGVDGVLYGNLMDFDETTTGVYNVRKVRATFKLVDTKTGQPTWTGKLGVKTEVRMSGRTGTAASAVARSSDARDKDVPWVLLDSTVMSESNVGRAAAINLGAKLFTQAVGLHLDYESTELARRVTQNLPWGPGPESVALRPTPPTPPAPKIRAPRNAAMEPPSFGYLDYGKRDFSAVMITTTQDKKRNESHRMEIPLARAGDKMRMDMDMGAMAQGAAMPPAMSKMSFLQRGDQKLTFTLYPNAKKFMKRAEQAPGKRGDAPKVEKIKVGSEVIDKHPSDKYKVTITMGDGAVQEGYVWDARDLDNMTIRSEIENNDIRTTTEFRNIVLATPPAALFEVPTDYTETQSMMDIMMNAQ